MVTIVVLQSLILGAMGKIVRCQVLIGDHRKPTQICENAEAADIAWEWLRRNSDYERDYRALQRNELSSATTGDFRQLWGLSFRG